MSVGAQERVTTIGLQFKPMLPAKFFGVGPESIDNGEIIADFLPRFGRNVGVVVRQGINRMWSFETGITQVQRNFHIDYRVPGLDEVNRLSFRFIGYEVPLQGLVYVQLGKQLWMNASAGVSLNMFPSDAASRNSLRRDTLVYDFYQDTFRKRWIQMAALINYGFEWRTSKSGFFYLGASLHRPFTEIAFVKAGLDINTDPTSLVYTMTGNYFTVDLRYFFHEDPARRQKKMVRGPS